VFFIGMAAWFAGDETCALLLLFSLRNLAVFQEHSFCFPIALLSAANSSAIVNQ